MERELPTIARAGTEFVVDITEFALREKSNPENRIYINEMSEFGQGYLFQYNIKEGRVPTPWTEDYLKDLVYVKIPEFVALDPVGMAKKYNLTVEEIRNKRDFDLMVDREAFDRRVNKGVLPTINIQGCIFVVELDKGVLRPNADFSSKALVLTDFKDHLFYDGDCYMVPFDTKAKEFRRLDYDTITKLPEELILVSFPNERQMDPVGWNIRNGLDPKFALKTIDLKPEIVPDIIPWGETMIPGIIKDNLKKMQLHQPGRKEAAKNTGKQQRKRGRKI